MQAACFLYELFTGTQEQVIGIAQNDLGAHIIEFFRRQRLDRGLRTDGHKHRRLECAVGRAQETGPGTVTFGL